MIGIGSIIFQFKTEITHSFSFPAKNPSGCESKDDSDKTVPGGRLRSLFIHEVREQPSLQLYVTFTSPFSSH